MQPQRGRRSAFASALSILLLFPVIACAAQTDATPDPEPEVPVSEDATGATNGTPQEATFVAPKTEAGQALATALADARATDRLVFIHSGADW